MNNNSNKTKEIFDNIVNRLQSIIDKGDSKVVIDLGNKIKKCANEFINKIEKFDMQELELSA
ncbi:MAG: hypothetical protein HFJ52_08885 [Clostridia bacterium]|nr:hypothetical protein [Clostridia bacterium]